MIRTLQLLINAVHSIGRCNTILIDLRFKDGVYEPAEAVETFFHAENGYLASVEGGAVLA
jgi:hypothetical protein